MTKLQQIVKKAQQIRKQYPNKYSKWTDYIKAASKQIAGFEGVTRQGNKTTVKYSRAEKATAKKKAAPAAKKSAAPAYQKSLFGVNKKVSGLTKISGTDPHKGKYFIDYTYNGVKQIKYFEKMPKDVYRGYDGGYYMMALSDRGTILTPLNSTKTNKQIKRK
jgi:hypothetical protein